MTAARAFLDRWSSGGRPWAALILLCLALYLPGIAALPPFDRDESRFVQATRQMLDTGDFVQIRFQDEARNKKPVGIHWLQAAAVSALSEPASTALWPYRLVSALAATLAVLLTFLIGRTLLGAPAALLGAAASAGMLLLVVEAHLAKTDAALLADVLADPAVHRKIGSGAASAWRRSSRGRSFRCWHCSPWRSCRSPTVAWDGSCTRGRSGDCRWPC